MRSLALVVLVLALAGVASAASSDLTASRLTLVTADMPGATQRSQGPIHEKGYSAGYQRSFTFGTPNGRSGIVFVESEALVAAMGSVYPTAFTIEDVRGIEDPAELEEKVLDEALGMYEQREAQLGTDDNGQPILREFVEQGSELYR